jgi:diacylglycerol O-acyltransferase-1
MLIPLSIPISLWIESFGASYASYYTVALVKKTSQSAQLLSQRQQVEGRLQWAHYLLLLSLLFLPNLYCFWYMEHPAIILLPVLLSVILVLKLSSFMWVNHDLRAAYMDGQPVVDYGDNVTYPRNVTFGNIAYFIFAPTLCYQPAYPRNDRFRSSFFAKRVLELLTLLGVMYFLSGQYVVPTLRNSLKPFAQLNLFALLERLLKLSIPSIYCWLIMFYGVFHSYLNIWAELLRFGDRQFYKPW